MPQKTIEFKGNKMDLGLNLQPSKGLAVGEISGGASARVEVGGGIYSGPGYSLQKDLGTSLPVEGLQGTKVFPALWAKSGTQVFYSETPPQSTKWYNLNLATILAGLTSGIYTQFVEQGNGDVHVFNTTDTPIRLAIAKNTVAIADAASEITVGANEIGKFSTAANGTVNGDAFAWTGKNATQLTGVTGISGAKAVGSLMIEATNPSTFAEKPAFGFEFQSRFIIGGRTDFEGVVQASAPEDMNNPAFYYDFDANGTVARTFGTKMVGGIKGIGRAFLFGTREVYQLEDFDIATGAFIVQPISEHYGAYNNRCIVDMDGIVAFLGNKRLMPIALQLSPEGSGAPFLQEDFDYKLRPWLDGLDDQEDQTDAHLAYNPTSKILKISARRGGALETYCCDMNGKGKSFLPTESRPGFFFTQFNGNQYFGDTVGRVFRDDYGTTNNTLAILHKWATGRMEYDKGRGYMHLYALEYEGFMSDSCEHTVRVYIDGSSTPSLEKDIDDSVITSTNGWALGSRGVGVSTIGDGDSQFAFPYEVHVLLTGIDAEDVKVEWECRKKGAFFQLNSFNVKTYLIRHSQHTSQ